MYKNKIGGAISTFQYDYKWIKADKSESSCDLLFESALVF